VLPVEVDAFCKHCKSARSFADRDAIVRTIKADFESPPALLAAVCRKRGLDPEHLYGERLVAFLECTYIPNASGRWPTFETTHDFACRQASLLRHEPFARLLLQWLAATDRHAKLIAAYFIGHFGSDAQVELACKIARDPDPILAAHLISGAGETASIHASDQFRRQVFDAGSRLLESHPGDWLGPSIIYRGDDFIGGLRSIDHERAMNLLTSKQCLRVDNPCLKLILGSLSQEVETLRVEPFSLSPQTLWPLYEHLLHKALKENPPNYNNTTSLGNILALCAVADPQAAISAAKDLLRNKVFKKHMQDSANRAIKIALHVPDLHILTERVEDLAIEELNEHERILLAMEPWNYTVNDGLIGFFIYRSDRVAGAIEALRRLRHHQIANELEAAALVVQQLPDAEAEIYQQTVLTQRVGEAEKLLERKASAVINAVERYVLKHKKAFVGAEEDAGIDERA